ncbi:MAG: chromate transporter [Bacteroidota bacterium]
MAKTLFDIFLAFFRPSILSYGGGPASIPLMQKEVVDNYRWLTGEQFADALAIGNTLPGPIAPKMGAYIGYNVAGILGAVVAILATVAPTAIIIVILAKYLLLYKNSPRLQGMLRVAKPIVVVLLLQTAIELMTKKTYPNPMAFAVSAVALIAVLLLGIHPAIVIAVGLATGFTFYRWF